MKTSVEKLYFDWQDPNTGEYPKSYGIRVHAPGTRHDYNLKSHYLVSILRKHGGSAVNFPKQLLTEIYEDCCWAFAGVMFTDVILAHFDQESHAAHLRNYTHMSGDEWEGLVFDITERMRLRIIADTSKYLETITAVPTPESFRNAIMSNRWVVKANEEYAGMGDWILGLEDQSLMPELTLALLGLRRGFWAAYRRNCDDLQPLDDEGGSSNGHSSEEADASNGSGLRSSKTTPRSVATFKSA